MRQNGLATTVETMNLADVLDLLIDKLPGFRRQIADRVSDDVAGEGAAAALEECQLVVSLWSVCGQFVEPAWEGVSLESVHTLESVHYSAFLILCISHDIQSILMEFRRAPRS